MVLLDLGGPRVAEQLRGSLTRRSRPGFGKVAVAGGLVSDGRSYYVVKRQSWV